MIRATTILAVCLAASATAAPLEGGFLDLRIEPPPDLYLTVRSLAATDTTGPAELATAVAAARRLDAVLPSGRAWALLDGSAAGAPTVADLAAAFDRFPETFVASTGDTLRVQPQAQALGADLQAIEPWYRIHLWPAHAKLLDAAKADLDTTLLPKESDCFRAVTADLGMVSPDRPVPVFLVANAPPPGGVTVRFRSGAASFVGVADLKGSTLAEVVLHESLHILDVETRNQPTALNQLRKELVEAGVPQTDPRYRDIPHALIFVEAAETVRRVLDPAHVDFGESHGVYARLGEAATIVRPLWRQRLDGTLDLDAAIRRMVEATIQQR